MTFHLSKHTLLNKNKNIRSYSYYIHAIFNFYVFQIYNLRSRLVLLKCWNMKHNINSCCFFIKAVFLFQKSFIYSLFKSTNLRALLISFKNKFSFIHIPVRVMIMKHVNGSMRNKNMGICSQLYCFYYKKSKSWKLSILFCCPFLFQHAQNPFTLNISISSKCSSDICSRRGFIIIPKNYK